MSKRARFILILVLIGISATFLYPTIKWYFFIPQEDKQLSNGSSVQIRKYAQNQATEKLDQLEKMVKTKPDQQVPKEFHFLIKPAKEGYKALNKEVPKEWTVENLLRGFATKNDAFNAIENHFRKEIMALKDLRSRILQLGLDLSGGMSVVLEADIESLEERLDRTPTAEDKKNAINRAMEILTNRIDRFGVTEPEIRKQGDTRINIEIPGEADPERVRTFLRGKGSLNFHIVDDEATQKLIEYQQNHPGYIPESDRYETEFIPAGSVVRGYYTKDEYGLDKLVRYIVITEEVGLDGSHIRDARVARDPITNQPTVNFLLDNEGGEIFYKLTDANVGKSLAIVMDDKVKAYARISEAIRDSVRISGFNQEEAQNLALVLRTAAMPVDLNVVNQLAIGASLGQDSIRMGLRAILLGFSLVIVFMIFYYKGSGIVADLALILNLFFIVSILSVFNLTLTLTSIAGIILTVGMAVDANVIIFERVKEEYRLGKTPQASVTAGFRKAFWTVMDANITTFIAAIFLSQLGKGPIQGFAVTLAVGIVSSMFTALVISRLIFDFSTQTVKVKKLSISWRL